MSYTTSDLALTTYICMRGHRVIEIIPEDNRLKFVIDIPREEAFRLQDEFISSDCATYYNVLKQLKSLIHNYKERHGPPGRGY